MQLVIMRRHGQLDNRNGVNGDTDNLEITLEFARHSILLSCQVKNSAGNELLINNVFPSEEDFFMESDQIVHRNLHQ